MKTLSILLSSSGGAGETLFIGVIIGLIVWGFTSIWNKRSDDNQNKKDEASLKLLKENIVDKGGLPIILNELFEYLNSTLNLEKTQDLRSIVTMSSVKYEVTFMLFGDKYDTMSLSIRNISKDKTLKWRFQLSDPQEVMISMIDTDINAKKWEVVQSLNEVAK